MYIVIKADPLKGINNIILKSNAKEDKTGKTKNTIISTRKVPASASSGCRNIKYTVSLFQTAHLHAIHTGHAFCDFIRHLRPFNRLSFAFLRVY